MWLWPALPCPAPIQALPLSLLPPSRLPCSCAAMELHLGPNGMFVLTSGVSNKGVASASVSINCSSGP